MNAEADTLANGAVIYPKSENQRLQNGFHASVWPPNKNGYWFGSQVQYRLHAGVNTEDVVQAWVPAFVDFLRTLQSRIPKKKRKQDLSTTGG